MKNLSIFILTFSFSWLSFSQDDFAIKAEKNQINFYAPDIINGFYTFSYERAIGKHTSVNLGFGYKTEQGLIALSGIDTDQLKTNNLTYSGFKIVPEFRYYLHESVNGAMLSGFYFGAYLKYSDFKSDLIGTFINSEGESFNIAYRGEIDVTSVGLMIGYKLPVAKHFFIDFLIAGPGLIYTQNYNNNDNFEFRLIQGFKFEIPTIPTITLDNFVRLEERFQNPFNDSGWTSAFRLRYKISTILNWKKHYLKFTDGLYIPIQTEFFFNLKRASRYNDLIRLSPGLGYKSENDWRYELYVIFNKTKNITETTNKSNDFILRLRIYQGHPTKQVFDFDQEDTF